MNAVADNDPRLGINQAAAVIAEQDPGTQTEWYAVVVAQYNADRDVARAGSILSQAQAHRAAVGRRMRETAMWAVANNADPARSIPNLVAAAKRELGL